MKNQIKKQEIAQLLSKFMAGETSVAEEEVLAQYFRTHEVDEEWTEYKEMFTLFDNGQVDIEIEDGTSEQPIKDDSAKIQMLPKTVREKPKIVALRWLMVGIAASIVLLLVFHLGRSTAEQPSLVAEKTEVLKDSIQPKHETITPTEKTKRWKPLWLRPFPLSPRQASGSTTQQPSPLQLLRTSPTALPALSPKWKNWTIVSVRHRWKDSSPLMPVYSRWYIALLANKPNRR